MIVAIDIDAQKTFTPLCPDELPIQGGDEIVAELNQQAQLAQLRVMTKDAHSSSAAWICATPQQMHQATHLPEADTTWLAHAIVGSKGYELLDGLPQTHEYDFCVWKGIDPQFHPYGACFHDLSERLSTGLIEWLQAKQATILIIGGLATDFCVQTTVLQLLKWGNWKIIVNRAACRGIRAESSEQAWKNMQKQGAIILENAQAIQSYLNQYYL